MSVLDTILAVEVVVTVCGYTVLGAVIVTVFSYYYSVILGSDEGIGSFYCTGKRRVFGEIGRCDGGLNSTFARSWIALRRSVPARTDTLGAV